jgi:general secretion pathway protein C
MLKRYQTIFNLFALAVIVFLAVDLFYALIMAQLRTSYTEKAAAYHLPDTKSRSKRSLNHYRPIIQRNIFGSSGEPSQEMQTEKIEDLEHTSLKIALLGTVVDDRDKAIAVIEESDKKKQDLYRVGDTIQNAVVKKILRGKVVLSIDGKEEILTMEESSADRISKKPPPSRPRFIEGGDNIVLSHADLERSLENIHQLLSQAKVRPRFRDGKTQGLSITSIKPGSLFEKLGLRNGDIIQGIDGRDIQNTNDVMQMYDAIKSGGQATIQVLRRGKEKIINYTFR